MLCIIFILFLVSNCDVVEYWHDTGSNSFHAHCPNSHNHNCRHNEIFLVGIHDGFNHGRHGTCYSENEMVTAHGHIVRPHHDYRHHCEP